MTMLDSTELPLHPAADAPGAKFTEEQARQWLASNGVQSVRLLAKLWGWHPSKVQRFLSRVRGETPRETPTVSADTPDTPETPQGRGRVLGRTPSGTVVAAMPDASDLTDDSPIATAPYRDDFDWSPSNEDIIVAPQQAIAVYRNAWNQVVIRAAGEGDYGEDVFIAIAPEHAPALIAKLSAILKEVG